jgi:hypothetical protein
VIEQVDAPVTASATLRVPPSEVKLVGDGVIEVMDGPGAVTGGCDMVSVSEAVPPGPVTSSLKLCEAAPGPGFAGTTKL